MHRSQIKSHLLFDRNGRFEVKSFEGFQDILIAHTMHSGVGELHRGCAIRVPETAKIYVKKDFDIRVY